MGSGSAERWTYGKEVHAVLRERQGSQRFSYDQLLKADGSLTNRFEDGRTQTVPAAESDESGLAADLRRDVVAGFREDYEQGVLDESGTATFAGRSARRYVVASVEQGFASRVEYYVDAETGAPLGSVTTREAATVRPGSVANGRIRPNPADKFTIRTTTTIDRVERLPVTPETLRLVRER